MVASLLELALNGRFRLHCKLTLLDAVSSQVEGLVLSHDVGAYVELLGLAKVWADALSIIAKRLDVVVGVH